MQAPGTRPNAARTSQFGDDGGGGGGALVTSSWREQLIAFAQLNIDPSINALPLETDLEKYWTGGIASELQANNLEQFATGTGAILPVPGGHSGQIDLTTGAAAGTISAFGPYGGFVGGGGGNKLLIDLAAARPWVAYSRLRLRTAPDADTAIFLASIVGLNTGPDKFIAIRAVEGTPRVVYGIDTVWVLPTTADIPSDGLFHEYVIGYTPSGPNGVPYMAAFLDMNPTPIGSFEPTLGQVDTDVGVFRCRCATTTAATQIVRADRFAVATNGG